MADALDRLFEAARAIGGHAIVTGVAGPMRACLRGLHKALIAREGGA